MKAHSKDLRRKIVEAVERGKPRAEAARTFGVGLSSVKRWVATLPPFHPMRYRSTARSSHSIPIPGPSGTRICPSSILMGF
ncbi:MAG: helix-turn-helix domain-containing protein [Rubrobacteraceae bacterium]|nr:helix-turn-helix domain-containing protein [Rubrobacteraceae bacterium]